ncbi:MAG TPA: tetratricopeptide repeat protein [Planctomycetota bacterium]|nr:tetratricopeptide repeat protein [Planctomycetota bacterium]
MGRFSNLEFDGNNPLREEPQLPGELRDDAYYLKAADQDYRAARFDRALRYYSRALEYNANVQAAWVGQVQMLIELGEYKEAKLWADKALELHRDSADLLSVKSVAWARQGDPQKAIEFSDAALGQRGPTPLMWLARGEALMAGRQANDDHCMEKAASESKQDWFMQLRIGRVYFAYRRFAQAMTWVSKAVKQEPAAPFALHVLGDCQLALGFASSSEHSYRQAISIDRDFSLSQSSLAALEKRGILGRVWSDIRGFLRRR